MFHNTRPFFWLLLLTLGVALNGSLGLAPTAPIPLEAKRKLPFFPTQLGTKWVYESKDGEFTRVISHVEEKDGAKLITIDSKSKAGDESLTQKILVNSNGAFLIEGSPFLFISQGATYDHPLCLFRIPNKAEDKWEATVKLEGGFAREGTFKIVGTKSLKVPGGTFDATQVDWNFTVNNTLKNPGATYWYADGIGLIKVDEPPVWSLKSFSLGKQ